MKAEAQSGAQVQSEVAAAMAAVVAVAEVGLLPVLRSTGTRCTVARRGFRGPTSSSLQAAPKDMACQRMRSCWSCEAPAYGKPVGERVREESSDRGNKNNTCVYVYLGVKRNEKNKHVAPPDSVGRNDPGLLCAAAPDHEIAPGSCCKEPMLPVSDSRKESWSGMNASIFVFFV